MEGSAIKTDRLRRAGDLRLAL